LVNQRRDHYRVEKLPKPTVNIPISLLRRAAPGRGPRPSYRCPPTAVTEPSCFIYRCSEYYEDQKKSVKTFNNGSLGSGIDEERSEMR